MIKEKMDLDIEISRLKLLKANPSNSLRQHLNGIGKKGGSAPFFK